jgi:hypothetical protein
MICVSSLIRQKITIKSISRYTPPPLLLHLLQPLTRDHPIPTHDNVNPTPHPSIHHNNHPHLLLLPLPLLLLSHLQIHDQHHNSLAMRMKYNASEPSSKLHRITHQLFTVYIKLIHIPAPSTVAVLIL